MLSFWFIVAIYVAAVVYVMIGAIKAGWPFLGAFFMAAVWPVSAYKVLGDLQRTPPPSNLN
jgi:hypothetical protein